MHICPIAAGGGGREVELCFCSNGAIQKICDLDWCGVSALSVSFMSICHSPFTSLFLFPLLPSSSIYPLLRPCIGSVEGLPVAELAKLRHFWGCFSSLANANMEGLSVEELAGQRVFKHLTTSLCLFIPLQEEKGPEDEGRFFWAEERRVWRLRTHKATIDSKGNTR